jgi:hypothetical protein
MKWLDGLEIFLVERKTMPSSPSYRRNYQAENEYKKKPEQIKKRVERNAARRKMEAAGKVRKGDGKDVAHINNKTSDNSLNNLKAQSPKKNRSYPRTKTAGKK